MRAFLEDVAGLELRIISCQPIPARWSAFESNEDLSWIRIPFENGSIDSVPQSKGFYCFFVGPPAGALPPVGYPMYLGRTSRTLQKRFSEYLHEQHDPAGRKHVRKFLNVFEGELTFMCTEFSGTYEELVATERVLLDAMMPAYSDSGYSAEVRAGRGAWQ
jgi:hypothetical protein